MKYILILNMGMKSIRSIIFDSEGNKLSSASLPLKTYISDDWIMQDPSEWWEKARIVITESLRTIENIHIDYLSVTSSSSCLISTDKNGNAIGNCIMVSDKRAISESKKLATAVSFDRIKSLTGLGSDSYLMLPKIMWVINKHPEIDGDIYKFLSPNDYLIGRLVGVFQTDNFNAQKYHYLESEQDYPEDLLVELGVDRKKLPDVVRIGSSAGIIKKSIAKELNLNNDVEVVVTSYDAICSFFGSGVAHEGDACDVSGTVTTFRTLSYKKNIKSSDKIFIMPYDEWNIKIVGGSNNLGGGLIEWAKQCFYIDEPYPYEIMEKEVNEIDIGTHGLIFLPYLLGERAPLWNNNARGVFFGLERTHTRKDMTRAVFESTGYMLRDLMMAVEETGVSVNRIRLSGGLSRINSISQIKADIIGREVTVLDELETTASGSAMLVLVGKGIYKTLNDAALKFVTEKMTIRPNMKQHDKYMILYEFYKKLYASVQGLYDEHLEITKQLYPKKTIMIQNL